jgi:hypothetical protein
MLLAISVKTFPCSISEKERWNLSMFKQQNIKSLNLDLLQLKFSQK